MDIATIAAARDLLLAALPTHNLPAMVPLTDACAIVTTAADIATFAVTALLDGQASASNTAAAFKSSSIDFATETDLSIERMAFDTIAARFPHHHRIGEESAPSSTSAASGDTFFGPSAITWVIDPVDGTTNYTHGFPFVCISIAVVVAGEPLVGLVAAPFLRDGLYFAWLGLGMLHGSTWLVPLADRPTPPPTTIAQALIATGYSYDRSHTALAAQHAAETALAGDPDPCRGIRNIGCAVMAMTLVATGALDAYFIHGLHIWDMAAAVVFLRQLGAVLYSTDGSAFDLCARNCLVAATDDLAAAILPCLTPLDVPREIL
ncbi:inositol monophosphatase [Thecamonas trahens ATCC 50062]|uniref:Inositol monophosphatase n=1 Tax=Thecamonas trahens ATCC 50062 TaxID=461836 RepID=A0A0L0DQT6_THETB|nr:inositol monophosphatase [Thecamonas trahens ATCC 50062]KNC54386.1 inositol monophosphatase [Thecamonas trahens ATCC 50062]|eukprot:XP_013753685.1 inositol monophosphatase [Thecamonas trahens ATCC 50062]